MNKQVRPRSTPKERVLAVERILQSRQTVTMKDIISELSKRYDIEAERKSIYDDIAVLTVYMPIVLKQNRYYLLDETGI